MTAEPEAIIDRFVAIAERHRRDVHRAAGLPRLGRPVAGRGRARRAPGGLAERVGGVPCDYGAPTRSKHASSHAESAVGWQSRSR